MSRRCETYEPLQSAWVDGELRGGERARFAAHLQQCARCRGAVHELRVTQSLLRSAPVRNLVIDITREGAEGPSRGTAGAGVRRVLVRSLAALVLLTGGVGAAAFVAGSTPVEERRVAVPVDVFVADHMVRAVGGPVSTPALVEARP